MLEMDPNKRFSTDDILKSDYFNKEPKMCNGDG